MTEGRLISTDHFKLWVFEEKIPDELGKDDE